MQKQLNLCPYIEINIVNYQDYFIESETDNLFTRVYYIIIILSKFDGTLCKLILLKHACLKKTHLIEIVIIDVLM